MFLLTYHGDEVITRLFSTQQKAIDYATTEVDSFTGSFDESTQLLTLENVNQDHCDYLTDIFHESDVEVIILDQPEGDFRIYTIEPTEIDPTFKG